MLKEVHINKKKKIREKESTNQFKESTDRYLEQQKQQFRIRHLMYQTLQKKLMKM